MGELLRNMLKDMMDFLISQGVDTDRAGIVSGLALVVIVFIAVVLLSQLMLLPGQVKNKKEMNYLTGRAVGTILSGEYYITSNDVAHPTGQTPESSSTHTYIVTYEFKVNGVTYQGQGEGSYAFWERKRQTICYDPKNPEDNCTLFYYDSKTDTNVLKTVFSVSIWVILFFAIIIVYLFSR